MPKVLLVEDDNNLREIFQMRLQAEGYTTVVAADGEEGLVMSMKERPDLVIADVMMPKLSGFEMVESLRAAPETKDIKVIMMTALGQAEDQARGEKLGVVKYLVKSQVTLEDFARVVKEALGPGDPNAAPAASKDEASNNNQQESENHMQEEPSTTPAPVDPAAPAADPGVNPVSGDAPADNSVSTDQQSTAQEAGVVQNQIDNFAAPAPADPVPAPEATAPEMPAAPAPEAPAAEMPAAPAPEAPADPTATPPVDPTSNAL
ncbi:response regulator [Candidatus Saccharibacteria bacterium]|nr:response regulator [Candidatus Saccharibacteria bacterium]